MDQSVTALLITASILDAFLAVLLIGVSGFIFGSGPEGMSGDASGVAVWSVGFVACVAAPVGGFVLRGFGKTGLGVLLALSPLAAALLLTTGLLHPY